MDCVTGHNIASTMLETVPEFREVYPYPMTIVMDSFADYVSDRARNGTPEHLLRPYFEFVERLAASDDQELHNLVVVDFLEAAPWELLGVGELLGPATRTLADTTSARRRETRSSDRSQREHPHAEILRRFPELGEDFGLSEVLSDLAQFVWEAHIAERDELVRRAFGFVEWLAEHDRTDLAIMAVSPLFFDLDEPMIERLGMGTHTAKLVVERAVDGS